MKPICIFLLLFFPTSSHVVFEEIGTMAGSTSYIHITVRIGLQEIEDKVMEYSEAVLGYKTQIIRVFDDAASSDGKSLILSIHIELNLNQTSKLKPKFGIGIS